MSLFALNFEVEMKNLQSNCEDKEAGVFCTVFWA